MDPQQTLRRNLLTQAGLVRQKPVSNRRMPTRGEWGRFLPEGFTWKSRFLRWKMEIFWILVNKQLNDNQMKSSLRPGLLHDMFSVRDPRLNFYFSCYWGGWWASKDIPLTEDEMAKTVKPKWWSWEWNWAHPEKKVIQYHPSIILGSTTQQVKEQPTNHHSPKKRVGLVHYKEHTMICWVLLGSIVLEDYRFCSTCIFTARISCLPASATPLVSEWCKCIVSSGISEIVAVYVP